MSSKILALIDLRKNGRVTHLTFNRKRQFNTSRQAHTSINDKTLDFSPNNNHQRK